VALCPTRPATRGCAHRDRKTSFRLRTGATNVSTRPGPLRKRPASGSRCTSSKNTAVPGGRRSSRALAKRAGDLRASRSASSSQLTYRRVGPDQAGFPRLRGGLPACRGPTTKANALVGGQAHVTGDVMRPGTKRSLARPDPPVSQGLSASRTCSAESGMRDTTRS